MSDPRTELVAAGYDAMIDTWEAWKAQIGGDPRAEWCEELVARLPTGSRVVELGCGGGTDETRLLARHFELTGFDLSSEQLGRAPRARPGSDVRPGRPHRARARGRLRRCRRLLLRPEPCPARASLAALRENPPLARAGWVAPDDTRRERPRRLDGRVAGRPDVLLGLPPTRIAACSPRPASSSCGTRSSRSASPRATRRSIGCWPADELRLRPSTTTASSSTLPRRAATASRTSTGHPRRATCCLRHDVDLSLDAALRLAELEAGRRRLGDVLPDDRVGLLQPRLERGSARARPAARARPPGRSPRRVSDRPARRALRPRRRLAQPRARVHVRAARRRRERHAGGVLRPADLPLRLEPALAFRLPARGAPRGQRSPGSSCSPTRSSGSTRARPWARRCARCSTPSGSGASGSSRTTASTSRERGAPARRRRRQRRRARSRPRRRHRAAAGGRRTRRPSTRSCGTSSRSGSRVPRASSGSTSAAARPSRSSRARRRSRRCPSNDEAVWELGAPATRDARRPGRLRLHTEHRGWQRMVGDAASGEVVCHNDLFWPNVVFRDGVPSHSSTGISPLLLPGFTTSARPRTSGSLLARISSARPGGSPPREDVNGCWRSVDGYGLCRVSSAPSCPRRWSTRRR